jgi:hypothetical protein
VEERGFSAASGDRSIVTGGFIVDECFPEEPFKPSDAGLKAGPSTYASRLIIEATYPAPKPLSMLTTVTFEAQEFSIPSNAAMPWYDAP